MLLSALSWGRLCGDPVHNEVRPDGVGAAIYSSVSPKEGHRLTRTHQRPDVSGAGHRSSSVLFLPSVRALILSGVASTLPLAALRSVSQGKKRSPLLKSLTIERCAKAGRPRRLPRDGEALPQAYGRQLLWLVSWRSSCHHVFSDLLPVAS